MLTPSIGILFSDVSDLSGAGRLFGAKPKDAEPVFWGNKERVASGEQNQGPSEHPIHGVEGPYLYLVLYLG